MSVRPYERPDLGEYES